MAETTKDTIYIDVDDEITVIIDKLRASKNKVVALVLPKRATTLQSVVNMKLLKRAADDARKNMVLVTTEVGLLPLAGAVGIHVAKTPTSRPEIPPAPLGHSDEEEQVDEVDLADELPAGAASLPIGDLAAGAATMPIKPPLNDEDEALEIDNVTPAVAEASAVKVPKTKKDKKLHVPDFDKFRMILVFGGLLLVVLIVGGYFAFAVLPKATISIKTDASNVNTNVDFSLSTAATKLSTTTKVVPAKKVQAQKTLTGTAPATGQQNSGDKADGVVAIAAQECGSNAFNTPSLSAGSGIAANGLTYITQDNAKFNQGDVNKTTKCINYTANGINIKAQSGGAKFNTDTDTKFTVSGHADITSITGSADGGTDNIQTVISQADIDAATAKISSSSATAAQQELLQQLQGQGEYAITSTYSPGTPTSNVSAKVGDQASSVTVTQTITYTMLGVDQNDIKTLVDNDIKRQIDTSAQGILSQGITQSAFKLKDPTATGVNMNIQTTAVVGPSINPATVAKEAAGKKSAAIKSSLTGDPDVTDVTVDLSPFWVSKAPKNTSKITVIVAKPTKTADAN